MGASFPRIVGRPFLETDVGFCFRCPIPKVSELRFRRLSSDVPTPDRRFLHLFPNDSSRLTQYLFYWVPSFVSTSLIWVSWVTFFHSSVYHVLRSIFFALIMISFSWYLPLSKSPSTLCDDSRCFLLLILFYSILYLGDVKLTFSYSGHMADVCLSVCLVNRTWYCWYIYYLIESYLQQSFERHSRIDCDVLSLCCGAAERRLEGFLYFHSAEPCRPQIPDWQHISKDCSRRNAVVPTISCANRQTKPQKPQSARGSGSNWLCYWRF